MSAANLEKYHEALSKQDQNITFYLRHRTRLLQLLKDLKNGKLNSLDPINDTLINLEKRKLALSQHLIDLDSDYVQILKELDNDLNNEQDQNQLLEQLQDKIRSNEIKLAKINRFRSDLNTVNRIINKEFETDMIKISKAKIEELFKLENQDEYQLIFRKGELVDFENQIYKFTKIEFSKNLRQLSEMLKKEKLNCDALKNKIELDRLQWIEKQDKFVQLCTSLK